MVEKGQEGGRVGVCCGILVVTVNLCLLAVILSFFIIVRYGSHLQWCLNLAAEVIVFKNGLLTYCNDFSRYFFIIQY